MKIQRTMDYWQLLFKGWSEIMDVLYPCESERHDAITWVNNPASWMVEYDETIFDAWSNYDVADPYWSQDLEKEGYIKK